jgi:C1A family cysteine protease
MPTQIARFGWIPDLPDHRDHLYAAPVTALAALPKKVDLRKGCPEVYDQGQIGSCTANAIGAALEFDQMKQGLKDVFTPSRLFIYYNERTIEGSVKQDSGAMIRDGVKSVNQKGACPETLWPYDANPPESNKSIFKKPTPDCYKEASKHTAVVYERVTRSLTQMKACLQSGYPFVIGFSVYESFEGPQVAKTGHAPMPSANEQMLGGHAVLVVGYEDAKNWFIVRNSWGTGWGMKGYFTMPYAYLLDENLSDDFWTIKSVAG